MIENKLAMSQMLIKYESDLLHWVRHTPVHLYDSFHSYRCGQAYQGMPKVSFDIASSI